MTICIDDSCKTVSSLPENYYKGELLIDDILFEPKPALKWRGDGLPIVVVNQKNVDISNIIQLNFQNQDLEEGGSPQPDSVYHLYLDDSGNLLHSGVQPTFGGIYATLGGNAAKRFVGSYRTDSLGEILNPIENESISGIDQQKRFFKFLASNRAFSNSDGVQTILEIPGFVGMKGALVYFFCHIVFSSDQIGDQIEIRNNMLTNSADRKVFSTAAIANKRFSNSSMVSKTYASPAKDHAKLNIDFSSVSGNVTIAGGPSGSIPTRLDLVITTPLL